MALSSGRFVSAPITVKNIGAQAYMTCGKKSYVEPRRAYFSGFLLVGQVGPTLPFPLPSPSIPYPPPPLSLPYPPLPNILSLTYPLLFPTPSPPLPLEVGPPNPARGSGGAL